MIMLPVLTPLEATTVHATLGTVEVDLIAQVSYHFAKQRKYGNHHDCKILVLQTLMNVFFDMITVM